MSKKSSFRDELESLINRHNREAASDTPDFILAAFLNVALVGFEQAIADREKWYGRDKKPVESVEVR